jgi:hypothetical protein
MLELVWLSLKLSVVVIFVMFLLFMISCRGQASSQTSDGGVPTDREDSSVIDGGTADSSRTGRLPSMTNIGIVPSLGSSQ